MTVPAGGDIAIYNAAVKRTDYRLILGLDVPLLTAQKQELFNSTISAKDFWYTQFGSNNAGYDGVPEVNTTFSPFGNGCLEIRTYGGPPREVVITRPHWYPTDDRKSTTSFTVQFPLGDPIYDAVICVGSNSNSAALGLYSDPLRIVQRGSLHLGTAGIGTISYVRGGTWEDNLPNDMQSHFYEVIYDPFATNKLIIRRDNTPIHTSDPGATVGRPTYVGIGLPQDAEKLDVATTRRGAAGLDPSNAETLILGDGGALTGGDPGGTGPLLGEPRVIMRVFDLTVTCDTYETRTYPAWTTANAGGTLDTAVDGERFSLDGETWAKVPHTQVRQITTTAGRGTQNPFDTLSATILTPKASDPNGTPNWFKLDRIVNRHVILDTRVGSEATWSTWRRQFVGIIDSANWVDGTLNFTSRDRPSVRLDSFITRGYTDLELSSTVSGVPDDGLRSNLWLANTGADADHASILTDLIEVTDAVAGGVLGATDYQVRAISEVKPQSLSSGGQSLMQVVQEICDHACLEMRRHYTTSGTGRYGQIVINLWTMFGASGYTFRGRTAAGGNANILWPPGVSLTEDRRNGPAQAYYRNDSPVTTVKQGVWDVPNFGQYPLHPYPPQDRVLNDTYALFASTATPAGGGTNPRIMINDKNDTPHYGGVAPWRYRIENTWRRVATLAVSAHDWIEPSDVVTIEDAVVGIDPMTEVWVVDNRTLTIEGDRIITQVSCTPTDYENAIKRTI